MNNIFLISKLLYIIYELVILFYRLYAVADGGTIWRPIFSLFARLLYLQAVFITNVGTNSAFEFLEFLRNVRNFPELLFKQYGSKFVETKTNNLTRCLTLATL